MEREQDAWAAGFIDGEGHLGVHRIRDRRIAGEDRRAFRLTPRIIVGLTSRSALDWLALRYGGSVHLRRVQEGNHREVWVWEVNGARGVLRVLDAIEPYLKVKDREAAALRLLAEQIMRWRQGMRLTEAEILIRNDLSAAVTAVQGTSRGAAPTAVEGGTA